MGGRCESEFVSIVFEKPLLAVDIVVAAVVNDKIVHLFSLSLFVTSSYIDSATFSSLTGSTTTASHLPWSWACGTMPFTRGWWYKTDQV